MIHDKIAAAKQAKRQHLFKTLLFVSLISLLGVAFIIWASLPKSVDNATVNGVTESAADTDAVLEIDATLLRQAYIEAFAEFENVLRPQLEKIDLQQWKPALAERLATLEARALRQFSAGEYDQAYISIQALTAQAQNTVAESKQQFAAAMQNAQSAFDDNDYARARPAIDKAKMLDNTSEAARAFSERVEMLPEIAKLAAQIDTANAEKDRQRELNLIQQLLKLAPEREALKARAQELRKQISTHQFQNFIAQGYQALENTELSVAQTALDKARQIDPNQPAVRELNQAIQQVLENQQLQQLQMDAAAAESADNWEEVKAHLKQMQVLRPDDKAINDRLSVASDIVDLQRQIDKTLASPYRLSNASARDEAGLLAERAQGYQAQSRSLADKTRELNALITAIDQPVNVHIRSDNQTHIVVRGVGIVGEVETKTIQLKPGNYTFEGKRMGYKSKLKEVQVPLDQNAVSLTLVCDEPI